MRCIAFVFFLVSYGRADMNLGTTIVVGASKNKIVVAADSRSTYGRGNYTDHSCKITRLSDKLVFVSAGLVSDGSVKFDLLAEAKNSARKFGTVTPPAGTTVTEMVADDWLAISRIRLEDVAKYEMAGWLSTGLFPDSAVRFVGVFVGIEPDGKLALVSESLYCKKPATIGGPFGCDAQDHTEWGLGPPKFVYQLSDRMIFTAFGITDPTDEYINGDGRRAGTEYMQWLTDSKLYPDTHTDAYRAIRLIDLTIAYSPSKEFIGGAIDAVEVTHEGVHWVGRKSECPY